MTPYIGDGDWRPLAEEVSQEMDSAKLSALVTRLCRVLDEREDKARQRRVAIEFLSSPETGPKTFLPV